MAKTRWIKRLGIFGGLAAAWYGVFLLQDFVFERRLKKLNSLPQGATREEVFAALGSPDNAWERDSWRYSTVLPTIFYVWHLKSWDDMLVTFEDGKLD